MRTVLKQQKGFTLLEILLVVATIAILAGIVIIAINPGKQLGDTRNAQRAVDANTILNAVYQYALDNNGSIPSTITASATGICIDDAAGCSTGSLIVLSDVLVPDYIVGIPNDPSTTGATGTSVGYTIMQDATSGRITVAVPNAENNVTISITR